MNGIKQINLTSLVHGIDKACVEITIVMAELGLAGIAKAGMMQITGRFKTIPESAQMKNTDLSRIEDTLGMQDFELVKGE